MVKINFNKHIYEGWLVKDFINELLPTFKMIMSNNSHIPPFKNKNEIAKWCMDNQPYYKKRIPDVINYFVELAKEYKF